MTTVHFFRLRLEFLSGFYFATLLLVASAFSSEQALWASESNGDDSHTQSSAYVAYENDMERVDQALGRAIKQGKNLLLILGAQWCHDSQGFAAKINEPVVQRVIQQDYETLFIDVGYYKDKRDITQRFGYPTIFATPTVLIIDPGSEMLLNLDTLIRFNNADAIPIEDYVDYFADFSAKSYTPNDLTVPLEKLKAFEQTQTQRLIQGYEKLTPYMQADENDELEDKKLLSTLWRQVRDFRLQLQKDIHALRRGEINVIPVYAPQAWE